ncbi:hypothetical protein D9757_004511 [Collybiopsis confluens]|uniref:Uncharacterized protein n=1 Tax=Collybiopsis confluens TaxID=2823264 RepID=A0A8H5HWW6_9AGAR|nr:hypothetical protein D9757_004511 [Collybiopsis confluens]
MDEANPRGGVTLRRRINILERAHSFSKLNHSKPSGEGSAAAAHKPLDSDEGNEEEEPETSDREYESESGSSRTEGRSPHLERSKSLEQEQDSKPDDDAALSHHPARARSWYEFDLAVFVALVSPIGQWLTGGDHVKNILFVVLLIFYLHQVIEIPWILYHNSRPRLPPRSSHPPAAQSSHVKRAASELRLLEFFFFTLAVASPFLGVNLLRYVTYAVTGQDIHSWFSIGLFVLATGVRPWSHLVQRFTQRVTDLHDIVHYESSPNKGETEDVSEMKHQLEALSSRLVDMEKSMIKMQKKLTKDTNEVYDYIDEQIDPVEQMVKKHEKALEYVLHLPSSLLAPGTSSRQLKNLSPPKQLSPLNSPSVSLKYLQSPNHSGSSSPTAVKLETIHEEGKDIFMPRASSSSFSGPRAAIGVPTSPRTVIMRSPPSSPRSRESWPPMILRPLFVVLSLVTLPMLISLHVVYAITLPLRWSFWKAVRLTGADARMTSLMGLIRG